MVMNEMMQDTIRVKDSVGNSSADSGSICKTKKAKLDQLFQKYKSIFQEELPEGLPPKRVVDHAIDTGNRSPSAYQLSV
jgi:hypothetical protein